MGAFRERITKGDIRHATNPNLNWEQWHQEYLTRRTDHIDDEIHRAGRWIHVRLDALRGKIEKLARELGPEFPTLRALVAVANRHMRRLTDLAESGLASAADAGTPMTASQFRRIGLPAEAPEGGTHADVVAVAGDCIAGFYRNFASTPTGFEGLDIHAALPIVEEIFWGQFIAVQLEQLWQDCLWHGYRIEERGGESLILAPDSALFRSVVANEDRSINNQMYVIEALAQAWERKRRP